MPVQRLYIAQRNNKGSNFIYDIGDTIDIIRRYVTAIPTKDAVTTLT
jgi:hypothetical protein